LIDELFKHLIFYPVVIVLATLADIVIEAWLPLVILVTIVIGFWWITRPGRKWE
jgi:hypothetical protein